MYHRIRIIKPQSAEAYNNIGTILHGLGRQSEACQLYETSIRLNPEISETWANLGNIYREIGDHKKAIEYYNKALELNPDMQETAFNIGMLHYSSSNYREAIKYFRANRSRTRVKVTFFVAFLSAGTTSNLKNNYNK